MGNLMRQQRYLKAKYLFGVIDFYPPAIGVLEINLFHTISSGGDGVWLTGPVFKINTSFQKPKHKNLYVRYTETQVTILIMIEGLGGASDEVEVAVATYGKPGVTAIMKGFRYGVELKDLVIKLGTF